MDFTDMAQRLHLPTRAFIDGQWCAAIGGATMERINPANGQHLADIAACAADDVDKAVASCRRSFSSGVWADQSPQQRKAVMLRWAELLREHSEELALLETLDTGKAIAETRKVDVPSCAATIAWYAECIDKVYDEVAPNGRQALTYVTREPLGVVGAVVPWNYPLIITAWKLGPALASGNSVVLKPAEESSMGALRMAELAVQAGLPAGVLNVVPGRGEQAGKALGLHADVDAISFTGSTEVGKYFLAYAAQSNMKRISLECGGKSPHIVTADCADLDKAAMYVAYGIWYNQGQTCNAGSRLLVDKRIKDRLLEKVMGWADKLQPGNPLDPATTMGSLISEQHMRRVLGLVERGCQEGARLLLGGRQVREESGGYYVPPTILDEVHNQMDVARTEIFGPVLSVITYETLDEAVKIANDSPYGLAAAVWTDRLRDAHQVAGRLRAGTVWVNCYDHSSINLPFGGFKLSGLARDKSLHALDEYTAPKTTWIDLS